MTFWIIATFHINLTLSFRLLILLIRIFLRLSRILLAIISRNLLLILLLRLSSSRLFIISRFSCLFVSRRFIRFLFVRTLAFIFISRFFISLMFNNFYSFA